MSKLGDTIQAPPDTEKKYFGQVPHMASLELSPLQLALYVAYLRTCGNCGKCYKAYQTIADEAKMSVAQVKKRRKELEGLGFIQVDHAGRGKPSTITIVDIWEINIKYMQGDSSEKANLMQSLKCIDSSEKSNFSESKLSESQLLAKDSSEKAINKNNKNTTKEKEYASSDADVDSLPILPPHKVEIQPAPVPTAKSDAKQNAYDLATVIPDLMGLHNRREWQIAHMLSGTASKDKKNHDYAQLACYFEGDKMVTPTELKAVIAFFREKHPDADMIQSPQVIADWVGKYRAKATPPEWSQADVELRKQAMSPPDDPEPIGCKWRVKYSPIAALSQIDIDWFSRNCPAEWESKVQREAVAYG